MERPQVVKKRIDGKMQYSLAYGGKVYECKRTKNGRFFVAGYPQHEGSIVFLKKLVEQGLVCDQRS